jgi:hypothetical protein
MTFRQATTIYSTMFLAKGSHNPVEKFQTGISYVLKGVNGISVIF